MHPKKRRKEKILAAGFVDDVTYPDNSIVACGECFTKTWRVTNTGTIAWENMFLQCVDDIYANTKDISVGLTPLVPRIAIPYTAAGESVNLSVKLIAPSLPATVISYWKSVDAQGNTLLSEPHPLYCLVKVVTL